MADKLETDLHFAIVPRWVLRHPDLTAQAVRVYAVLADHAGKDRTAFPSRRTIGREAGGVQVPTVARALALLIEHGALTAEQTSGKVTVYTIHRIPVSPVIRGRITDEPGTRITGDTQKKTQLKKTQEVDQIAPAKRTRDLTFEAVAEACGWELSSLTKQSRGWINAALPELKRLDASGGVIRQRAGNYFLTYGKRPTPSALVKHWPAMAQPPVVASNRELARHSERERLHASREAAALKETG